MLNLTSEKGWSDTYLPLIISLLIVLVTAIGNFTNSDTVYLICEDVFTLCLAWLGFVVCPYSRFNSKGFLFAVLVWLSIVLFVNTMFLLDVFAMPKEYTLSVGLGIFALVVAMLLRHQVTGTFESTEPGPNHGRYYLTQTHTVFGLMQCLFMPWHAGRYETRAIGDGDYVWLVHRNEFKRVEAHRIKYRPEDTVTISLGRKLLDNEYATLEALEGKKALIGVKDCRALLVAGEPEQFAKPKYPLGEISFKDKWK